MRGKNRKRFEWAAITAFALMVPQLQGCLFAAAGAGAETAYVLGQEDRKASEVINDQRITASVKTALLTDSRVSAFDINVDTFREDVTLRGAVRSSQEADAAREIAGNIAGVRTVNSKIVVTP